MAYTWRACSNKYEAPWIWPTRGGAVPISMWPTRGGAVPISMWPTRGGAVPISMIETPWRWPTRAGAVSISMMDHRPYYLSTAKWSVGRSQTAPRLSCKRGPVMNSWPYNGMVSSLQRGGVLPGSASAQWGHQIYLVLIRICLTILCRKEQSNIG